MSELTRIEASATLLVVDDDLDIRLLLANSLGARGYRVETAGNTREMDQILARVPVDLVILDIMMPGEDGLSACRRIARPGGPEIIFLSALGEEPDRVLGLEVGGSHYLPKPCSPREILATVRAALRRRGSAQPAEAHRYAFEGWRIDLGSHELFDPKGVLVGLTDGEFAVLRVFIERPRRVLSREALLSAARGPDSDAYDRAIDVQVSRLRRKLRSGGDEIIRTVRNEGYLFVPKVAPRVKLRRNGAASPLFLRIFLLMLVCVGVVQLLNFALIIAVQPPTSPVYTLQQIARVIQVGKDSTGELAIVPGAEPTDHKIWAPRVERILPGLALVLGVPQERVDFGFVPPPFPQRAPTYDLSSAPPAPPTKDVAAARNFLVLDDFTASYQRPDGQWITVKPVSHAAALWRWYGLLWLAFTAAAVIPFAYGLALRLAKPIGAFAAAAERLGRDPRAPPLALVGPAEISDAAAAFNQMQGRLNRYVDDRTTMIGALAHDLRTPLMRLELRLEGAPPEVRAAAEADIREMEAMVAATLAYVRDTSQPTGRRPLDLRSLTESVTDDLSDRGAAVTLEPGDAVVLEGNPVALKAMLSNLITNALKYAGDAQVRLECEDDQVRVEVRDHGPGIPAEDLDRMFEPFFRGERSRNRKTGGIGLGLASARAVARAHGGDVTLENCSEGGLSALVTLPT